MVISKKDSLAPDTRCHKASTQSSIPWYVPFISLAQDETPDLTQQISPDDTQSNTLRPYLNAVRSTLTAALTLENFSSEVVERHNVPEVEARYVSPVLPLSGFMTTNLQGDRSGKKNVGGSTPQPVDHLA
jgi:hypothetical protein